MSNFKLTQTVIVTAISATIPTVRGEIYMPEERADVLEAEALERVGNAVKTNEKATIKTAAVRKAEALAGVEDETPGSGVKFEAIAQGDGTFKSPAGVRVNADGTVWEESALSWSDADLLKILSESIDEVANSLNELPDEPSAALLDRLAALEAKGKDRKGVYEALDAWRATE